MLQRSQNGNRNYSEMGNFKSGVRYYSELFNTFADNIIKLPILLIQIRDTVVEIKLETSFTGCPLPSACHLHPPAAES